MLLKSAQVAFVGGSVEVSLLVHVFTAHPIPMEVNTNSATDFQVNMIKYHIVREKREPFSVSVRTDIYKTEHKVGSDVL